MQHNNSNNRYSEMLDAFAVSDIGRRRHNNEDAALAMPRHGCFVISDGMGGGKAGEVASSMMVTLLERELRQAAELPSEQEGAIIRSSYEVNVAIKDYASAHGYSAMGATVVALLFNCWNPSVATVFHAGDSRLYRIRNGEIEQMTEDHTLEASAKGNGKKLPPALAGVLTNALGTGCDFYLSKNTIEVEVGDGFILCSDGLYTMVSDDEILGTYLMNSQEDSEVVCNLLLKQALENGGRDNVSIIVVKVLHAGQKIQPTEEELAQDQAAQLRNLNELADTSPTATGAPAENPEHTETN